MITKFIAEIGSNHNQQLSRTINLIRACKEAGFWAVKFQAFRSDSLYHYNYKDYDKAIKKLEQWELPAEFIPEIHKVCKQENIKLGFSVFDENEVDMVTPFADFLKIGSYEILLLDLIKKAIMTQLPIMISTGMASDEEIIEALEASYDSPFPILFACNSNYPANPQECDLYKIHHLRFVKSEFVDSYAVGTGWSDHTVDENIIKKAIWMYGAKYIEVHIDFNFMDGNESRGNNHVWPFSKIAKLIEELNFYNTIKYPTNINELRLQRADPEDGFRPMIEERKHESK